MQVTRSLDLIKVYTDDYEFVEAAVHRGINSEGEPIIDHWPGKGSLLNAYEIIEAREIINEWEAKFYKKSC
jgi:hypothetical protein